MSAIRHVSDCSGRDMYFRRPDSRAACHDLEGEHRRELVEGNRQHRYWPDRKRLTPDLFHLLHLGQGSKLRRVSKVAAKCEHTTQARTAECILRARILPAPTSAALETHTMPPQYGDVSGATSHPPSVLKR